MVALGALVVSAPAGDAVHFYRSSDFDCSPADGEINASAPPASEVDATVFLLHNSYHDNATLSPVTRIEPGDTVRWLWNSEHCHSVTGDRIASGFHYPEQKPDTQEGVPGLFHYPVPASEALGDPPTLSFTRTFEQEGVYHYQCVHHGVIGMQGVVVVQST